MSGSPTAMGWSKAKLAEVDERRAALIKLRRVRTPFDSHEILSLGYSSADSARKDFMRAVSARRKATEAEVADYRAEQSQIISDLLDVYLPLALGSVEAEPDLKAAEMTIKLLERDSKVNGYEAVLKAEMSGPGGGPIKLKATAIANLLDLINTAGDEDEDDEGLGEDPDDEDTDDDGDPDQA